MSDELLPHNPSKSPAAVAEGNVRDGSANDQAIAVDFLKQWDKAWAARDGHALAALHTRDAVTVNRYGRPIVGRAETEKWLTAMLGPQGSFTESTFPPMKLMLARRIAPEVLVVQAAWSAPALHSNGKVDPERFNDMIISYVLVNEESMWRAAEIDPHNIEKVDAPFSESHQQG